MSIHILKGVDGGAILYCSTTDWAFGPVFSTPEEAEAFLLWTDDLGYADPRTWALDEFERRYFEFKTFLDTEDRLANWTWARDVLGRVPIPKAFLDTLDPRWSDEELEAAWVEMMEGGDHA